MSTRKSTVFVSKEDKENLQKHCEQIAIILDKYPYSNDSSDNFVTSMTRVKNAFNNLDEWVKVLDVK